MPILLLALIFGVLLIWWLEKLSDVDQKLLRDVVKVTLFTLLTVMGIFLILTERLGILLVLMMAGLFYIYARRDRAPLGLPKPMTEDEALLILDLEAGSSSDEVQRAFRQKIAENHPDHGGTPEQARLLTEARDLLLKKGD